MLNAIRARSRSAVQAEESGYALPELQFGRAALQRIQQRVTASDRSGLLTFLAGPAGCGKSWLVRQALREAISRKRRTTYLILEPGDWEFARSLPDDSTHWEEWANACCHVDIVVCEDLDRVVTDPEFADRLANWIDQLLDHQIPVVLTSALTPADLTASSPRLASRLRGGLLARIPALSAASRRDFLRKATAAANLSLTEPVLQWIQDQPPGSLRTLRKIVDRLTAEFLPPARINDLEAVQRIVTGTVRQRLSLAIIAQEVATEFGVSQQELRASSRVQACLIPRQCAMHLAHGNGWPMSEIGRYFGKRTHTSVSYSCRRFQESMGKVPALRTQLLKLEAQLKERLLTDCG